MRNQDEGLNTGYLTECVFKNDVARLRRALAQGADPNERDDDGRTPLIHAAIDNQLEVAMILLDSGAEANIQDNFGNSALHYAAQEYHAQLASFLINRGAKIDIEDVHGNTPLGNAVFYSLGRGELIEILLKAGADRNHANKHGVTPIGLAETIANYDVKKFFV